MCCTYFFNLSDYKIDFKVTSDWGQAFNGEISITNKSEQVIEDWTLEFDFDRKISSFWTADIEKHEGNHYVIKNKGYNANIKAGETLTLGFAGAPGNVDNEPENYVLCHKNVKEEIDYEKDTDSDGLPDYLEKEIGTDPKNTDSDADGMPDGYEYFYLGTNPTLVDSDNNGISDADEDFDDDKLTNIEEFKLGTEPYSEDTDGDYLSDYEEVNTYKTDPLVADTDGDGICDGDEIKIGLDPLNKCTFGIPDSKYKDEQTIESDAINYNKTEDKYQVSLDVTASGCVENHLYIAQSPFYQMMSDNPAILGRTIEVNYDEGTVDKATIKFKVDDKYVEGASDADIDDSELVGLKRYNVFEYFEEDNLLLPIETTFNLDDNTVKAEVPSLGTYCIIDLVMLMDSWKQIDNAVSNEIEDEIPSNFNRASMSGIIDNNINFNRADNRLMLDFSNNMLFAPKTASEQKASVKIPNYIVTYGEYNGNQYALMEPYKSLTWEEARIKCELLGGHLATITDEKEQAFIVSRLLTKSNKYAYWIGGQYNQGKATWFTGERFSYKANDLAGTVDQKYLEICTHKNNVGPVIGTWQCRSNQIKNYGYICEWEKQEREDGTLVYISANGLTKCKLKAPLKRYGTTNSDKDSLTDSEEVNWNLMDADGSSPTLGTLMEAHAGYVVSGLDRLSEKEKNKYRTEEILPLLSDPRHEDSDGDGDIDSVDPKPLEYELNGYFIKSLSKLENLASEYSNGKELKYKYTTSKSDWYVLMFIRQFNSGYNSGTWSSVGGAIDQEFVQYVEDKDKNLFQYFENLRSIYANPEFEDLDIQHLAATATVLVYETNIGDAMYYTYNEYDEWYKLFKNIKKLAGNAITVAKTQMPEYHFNNLGGWAGDLQTLMNDVMQHNPDGVDTYKDFYTKLSAYLGDSEYSFSKSDIYADMDAYNIVNLCEKSSISSAFLKYYKDEYKKRVTNFTNSLSKSKIENLVYIYTKTKYLEAVKWPLLKYNFTDEQSKAARDAFVDYLIQERNKE